MCPVCKHPLETTIKRRHKTLGVVVPVWGPGPCHNPDCPDHLEEPVPNSPQDTDIKPGHQADGRRSRPGI